jgi:hypothetical protein
MANGAATLNRAVFALSLGQGLHGGRRFASV